MQLVFNLFSHENENNFWFLNDFLENGWKVISNAPMSNSHLNFSQSVIVIEKDISLKNEKDETLTTQLREKQIHHKHKI